MHWKGNITNVWKKEGNRAENWTKHSRKSWHVRLEIGDKGDLLRGVCFGRNRRPWALKAMISQDEFCEKRVLLYRSEGRSYQYVVGYEYFGNGANGQWIDMPDFHLGKVTICSKGRVPLEVYYGFPTQLVVVNPKEKVIL